ncbi:MAG: Eco57I restriction-modification methylase domain-containing protein [Gammaproteobacteria bacterium]|nr:Eco57I restriction-modification methylase domain-containing protein [Gammaproteobacteria bacterium]
MLSTIEKTRLRVSHGTEAKKKSQLGQFLTPEKIAKFMAELFPVADGSCRLLDAGAGVGSLSSAFIERSLKNKRGFDDLQLTAFELDESIHTDLVDSLDECTNKLPFSYEIIGNDFIEEAVNRIQFGLCDFTHAILNPPYKKISSNSRYRLLLRQVGIETVNLYAAFVALSVLLMRPGGQIVAIIPRSFCNGPYYRPFREFLFERTAIRHIHLFESRNQAFKDDNVLQENIIIHLECAAQQGQVTISTSADDSFTDLCNYDQPFNRIVFPDDPERFIHVPTSLEKNTFELSAAIRCSLEDIGLKVSTGPVVDYRLKEYLRDIPAEDTVPLLYPCHFKLGEVVWPIDGSKKPNAIQRTADTEKWLYPNGFYCVVRRFSSKEEKRRIIASVVDPNALDGAQMLGFENHLNVLHENKQGMSEVMARGLAVFLNTTIVDEHFRRFSGHTQVNATDLKLMKYPDRDILIELGQWAMQHKQLSQTMIDEKLGEMIA